MNKQTEDGAEAEKLALKASQAAKELAKQQVQLETSMAAMSKDKNKGGGKDNGKERSSKQKKSEQFFDKQRQSVDKKKWEKNYRSGWYGQEVARDVGAVTGLNLPKCLLALRRPHDVYKVAGSLCLELFCGTASLTLSSVFEEVLCMCPWDSSFGSEFDVLLHRKILFSLAVAGRLAYAHFWLPCQSLTWARSPPLMSWDHVWELPALKGQAAGKVLLGNKLHVFSVQLCLVLHADNHYFSSGRGLLRLAEDDWRVQNTCMCSYP